MSLFKQNFAASMLPALFATAGESVTYSAIAPDGTKVDTTVTLRWTDEEEQNTHNDHGHGVNQFATALMGKDPNETNYPGIANVNTTRDYITKDGVQWKVNEILWSSGYWRLRFLRRDIKEYSTQAARRGVA